MAIALTIIGPEDRLDEDGKNIGPHIGCLGTSFKSEDEAIKFCKPWTKRGYSYSLFYYPNHKEPDDVRI